MKTSALSRLTNAFAGSSCWKLLLEGHTPPSLRDTPSILEEEQVTQLHGIALQYGIIRAPPLHDSNLALPLSYSTAWKGVGKFS